MFDSFFCFNIIYYFDMFTNRYYGFGKNVNLYYINDTEIYCTFKYFVRARFTTIIYTIRIWTQLTNIFFELEYNSGAVYIKKKIT